MPKTKTLEFKAGSTSKFVSVRFLGDTNVERDEVVPVTLSNVTGLRRR